MASSPYDTKAWKRLRKAKLARDPLCKYCPRGTVTPATEVDHRVAISKGGADKGGAGMISGRLILVDRSPPHAEIFFS